MINLGSLFEVRAVEDHSLMINSHETAICLSIMLKITRRTHTIITYKL